MNHTPVHAVAPPRRLRRLQDRRKKQHAAGVERHGVLGWEGIGLGRCGIVALSGEVTAQV